MTAISCAACTPASYVGIRAERGCADGFLDTQGLRSPWGLDSFNCSVEWVHTSCPSLIRRSSNYCAGQVSGVGLASALFQYTLSAELRKRIHGADANEVRTLRASLSSERVLAVLIQPVDSADQSDSPLGDTRRHIAPRYTEGCARFVCHRIARRIHHGGVLNGRGVRRPPSRELLFDSSLSFCFDAHHARAVLASREIPRSSAAQRTCRRRVHCNGATCANTDDTR